MKSLLAVLLVLVASVAVAAPTPEIAACKADYYAAVSAAEDDYAAALGVCDGLSPRHVQNQCRVDASIARFNALEEADRVYHACRAAVYGRR